MGRRVIGARHSGNAGRRTQLRLPKISVKDEVGQCTVGQIAWLYSLIAERDDTYGTRLINVQSGVEEVLSFAGLEYIMVPWINPDSKPLKKFVVTTFTVPFSTV